MASVLQHTVGAEKMHDQYLPFSEAQLGECFAAVAAHEGAEVRDRRIAYYRDAVRRHEHAGDRAAAEPRAVRVAAQIEKDERIWVAAALMAVHYSDDRQAAVCTLLRRCLGDTPPFAGKERWEDCFGPDTRLFFEVGLPSPSSYQHWLRTNLAQRQLIPYVRDLARNGRRLEGRTHLDAMLIDGDTGCAVLVEGKVTSDCSCQVTFDLLRNQLARNIDAMLERNPDLQPPLKHRDPDLSAFVLLTPRMFQENPARACTAGSCRSTRQARRRFTATCPTAPWRRPTGTTRCRAGSAGSRLRTSRKPFPAPARGWPTCRRRVMAPLRSAVLREQRLSRGHALAA